jgi:hypothetical protein
MKPTLTIEFDDFNDFDDFAKNFKKLFVKEIKSKLKQTKPTPVQLNQQAQPVMPQPVQPQPVQPVMPQAQPPQGLVQPPPKAQPQPVQPQFPPQPTQVNTEEFTLPQLQESLMKLQQAYGGNQVIFDLLARHGVQTTTQLRQDQYRQVMLDAQIALSQLQAQG